MKKRFTLKRLLCYGLGLSGLALSNSATAQVATTYNFSQSAGTYTAASGGTVIASSAIGNMDEDVIPVNIPTFYFDGVPYTSIYVSTNGFITFGPYMPDTYFYEPLSAPDPYSGAIAAFGVDLDKAGSGTRNIRCVQVGNEFVIQWMNVRRYSIAGENISFQIRLNTVTNQINVVYGGTITPGNDQTYPQVGLRGPDNTFATNVNNREVLAATGAWVNSLPGTSEFSTCWWDSNNPATKPSVGTTFTWTPAPVDMQAISLALPNSNGCYGRNETVSVNIRNIGGAAINFATTPVTVNADASGPNPVTFTPVVVNSGTLAIGASQAVVLSTSYDMSQNGVYTFNASTSVTGDSHPFNDVMAPVNVESHTPTVNISPDVAICQGTMTTLTSNALAHDFNATFTNNTPASIPDDTPAGVNSTIVVSGQPVPASSVTVLIENLTHTYIPDLTLTLTAPDGSVMILSMENGAGDANMINTLFTASASTPISSGVEPFTGSFLPQDPFTNLTGTANGTWTLNVADNYAFDAGVLNSWSILIPVTNSISTYDWTPVASLSSGSVFNPDATPSGTTTYTVQVTDITGCSNSDQVTVTVNPLPTVTASSSVSTACENTPVTFNGGGTATSYTWSGGVTDNVPFNVTATDTYTVTGTDANGCSNTASVAVTVNPLPTVTATASASAVCDGNPVTLNGGGATSYSWTGSVTDNVPFTPVATDSYTVTGTDGNGCSNTASVTVTVNPLPTVTATANPASVCAGSPLTLSGNGATSYSWSGSVTDNVPFTPVATDSYTVTGTDANGCTNTASVTVAVNPLPTVGATTSASTVCAGTPVTFNGNGATSYSWTGSVTDNVPFTPSTSNSYTVTGTDANGCTNTASVTVTVNPLPVVTVSLAMDTVCLNGGLFTLNGESPAGGTWSGTGVSGNSFDPLVSGAGTTNVFYTYTDANSCASSDTAAIYVDVCNGIEAASAANASVYPNPTSGVFTIQLSAVPSAPVSVELMNSIGQSVGTFTMTGNSRQVDLSGLDSGIYLVRITNGTAVSVQRIVKE